MAKLKGVYKKFSSRLYDLQEDRLGFNSLTCKGKKEVSRRFLLHFEIIKKRKLLFIMKEPNL